MNLALPGESALSVHSSDAPPQKFKPTASSEDLSEWASPRQYHPATPQTSSSRVNLPPSMVPCRWYNAGYCARGDSCWYLHEKTNVKLRPLKLNSGPAAGPENEEVKLSPMQMRWRECLKKTKDEEKKMKMKEKGKAAEGVGEEGEIEGEEGEGSDCVTIPELSTDNCSICFEVPETYGLLSGCDHVFCLECIRKWREPNLKKHPFDDEEYADQRVNQKRCPICRVASQFVIPSSVFPTPPLGHSKNIQKREGAADEDNPPLDPNPAKAIIIANFLTKMKTIPCRYFTKPKKYIPLNRFGDATCVDAGRSPGKGTRKHPKRIPLCRHGNDCHYRHFHPEYPGLEYTYGQKELALIEKNNKLERERKRYHSWASLFQSSSALRRRSWDRARNLGLEFEDGDLRDMIDVWEGIGFDMQLEMGAFGEGPWAYDDDYEDRDDYDPDWEYDNSNEDEEDEEDEDEDADDEDDLERSEWAGFEGGLSTSLSRHSLFSTWL